MKSFGLCDNNLVRTAAGEHECRPPDTGELSVVSLILHRRELPNESLWSAVQNRSMKRQIIQLHFFSLHLSRV